MNQQDLPVFAPPGDLFFTPAIQESNVNMPRSRPQLSITLPRSFAFHYTEGEAPKTPEQHDKTPEAAPSPPQVYRLKRRARPPIQTLTDTQARLTDQLQNATMPTTESPPQGLTRPPVQHRATEPTDSLLAPVPSRPFMTLPRPRTPTMQRVHFQHDSYKTPPPKDLGEEITRPLSRFSIISDSSDVSSGSLTSYPSMGGSCTSPESDAADPFMPPSKRDRATQAENGFKPEALATAAISHNKKQPRVRWTSEMDKHLWSTYMQYLQDPIFTPFKDLPGLAPPLGVCHRVARQARRTWRGGQQPTQGYSGESSPKNTSSGSPETIKNTQSGSSTPTGPPPATSFIWPHSRSHTRRRLRHLAKRKPTIAPHYQRILRSPSPLSASSQSRSARASSPLCQEQSAFNTRDIQFSLASSTAATMQPDSYLARLSQSNLATPRPAPQYSSDPPVPWASPPPVPSSALPSSAIPSSNVGHATVSADPFVAQSQLGCPFSGSHTWGPSRSRSNLRPSTPRAQSGLAAPTTGPRSLKSPVRFDTENPYPSVSKRRAQHQLDDELSPGGSDKRDLIEELFSGHTEGRHRRVRSRGFSLGDVNGSDRLETLFQQPVPEQQICPEQEAPQGPLASSSTLQPPHAGESVRRLGSPFSIDGGRSMPTRRPSRHLASASLSAFDPSNFTSIDQRIRGTDLSEEFLKRLRE
ncbi:MAG: hypothetical protein Q9173_001440 [Seirophora scorigena]